MARLIAFDVDSTLLVVESLDFAIARAAEARGEAERVSAEVEALTARGMAGTMRFRDSLEGRLQIGRLSRSEIEAAAKDLAQDHATPGMAALLEARRAAGDRVIAISGGFRPLIAPALHGLGFRADQIFANDFVWTGDLALGAETSNPLSDNGGKPAVLERLPGAPKIMIGDGATDLEAYSAGAADDFIGFGGVKKRAAVAGQAPRFADDVAALAAFLSAP